MSDPGGADLPPPPPPPLPDASAKRAADGAPADASAGERPTRRARKSRWDTAPPADAAPAVPLPPPPPTGALTAAAPVQLVLPGGIVVELPPAVTGAARSDDPAVKRLYERLADLSRKLLTGDLGIPPEGERSPSPPPVYDRRGVRVNTRDVRARDKLTADRQDVMEALVAADPGFKPPPGFKPSKKTMKIYIPQREFPSFNFIGMVIGPRGATQKKLQAETGCRVVVRGRGSVKEGAARDPRHEDEEEDDLHVLIEGDTREAVQLAAAAVRPLLDPTNDSFHEAKDKQLRELAIINGTLKADDAGGCYLCGDPGHRQYECPTRSGPEAGYKLADNVQAIVEAQYARDVARMGGGGDGKAPDEEYKEFLAELGGGDDGGGGLPPPPRSMPPGRRGGAPPRPSDGAPNECKLFIGNVSLSASEDDLRSALAPHGAVASLDFALDAGGGRRGFAFVVMETPEGAAAACRGANGALVDGRPIRVQPRGGGPPPPGVPPGGFPLPPSVWTSRTRHGGGGPPPPGVDDDRTVHVTGLPPDATEADVSAAMTLHGHVVKTTLVVDPVTGATLGFAAVVFGGADGAARALCADGAPLAPGGPPVGVRRPPAGGGGGPTAWGPPRPRAPPGWGGPQWRGGGWGGGGWGGPPPPPPGAPHPPQYGPPGGYGAPPPPGVYGGGPPPPPGVYSAVPPPPSAPPPDADDPPPPPPDEPPPPLGDEGAPPPPPPEDWGAPPPPPPSAGWGGGGGWGAPQQQQWHPPGGGWGGAPPPGGGWGATPPLSSYQAPGWGAPPPPPPPPHAAPGWDAPPPPPPDAAPPPPPASPPDSGPRLEPRANGGQTAPAAAAAVPVSVADEYAKFLSELG